MKSSVFFSLTLVAARAAAQTNGIPSCANACINKYTTGNEIAGCKQLDIACICKNDTFLQGIACCLSTACDQADQEEAVQYAQQICSSQGVTTPDQVVCNQAASSDSASATASAPSSASASGASENQAASSTSGTQTNASANPTNTNAGAQLGGAGSLIGAAVAMLVAL